MDPDLTLATELRRISTKRGLPKVVVPEETVVLETSKEDLPLDQTQVAKLVLKVAPIRNTLVFLLLGTVLNADQDLNKMNLTRAYKESQEKKALQVQENR